MLVSVLIVTRNEEKYIIECIKSIESQFSVGTDWELIIVDGKSTDKTVTLASEYLGQNADYPYQILSNPDKILATGWNMGIEAAKGKYIIRPDAHAILYPGYIGEGITTLDDKPEVGSVGGVLKTLSKGFWSDLIKVALSSKIGVGDSSFRIGAKSGYKDTVVYGLYRKEVFDNVGMFNEVLQKHQDTEFHARLLKKDWKLWLNDKMIAGYYCRESLKSLARQMYKIGFHIPDLIKGQYVIGIQPRHLIPFFFFSILTGSFILGLIFKFFLYLALLQLVVYLAILAGFSIVNIFTNKKLSIKYLLLIPIIFTMHFFYFLGTFTGFLKKTRNNRK
jgi:glycosyltransferase involved in cell wall biosynthesis